MSQKQKLMEFDKDDLCDMIIRQNITITKQRTTLIKKDAELRNLKHHMKFIAAKMWHMAKHSDTQTFSQLSIKKQLREIDNDFKFKQYGK